jgi:hypothetical protein
MGNFLPERPLQGDAAGLGSALFLRRAGATAGVAIVAAGRSKTLILWQLEFE